MKNKQNSKEEKITGIAHPHDRITKRLLSNPATAKDILALYLPQEVLKIIDLKALELQRDSFIDDEHRAFAVDLLYKTKFQNEEGYLWILLEHQSSDDAWLPVRIFKYIATIWDHLRKLSKTTTIPLIYPIIIYNGQRPYSHTLILKDMIVPEAARVIFDNLFKTPLCLVDLSVIEDDELRSQLHHHIKGVALLMTLKHVFNRDLQRYFEHVLVTVFKELDRLGNRDDVVDLLYYLLNEGEFTHKEKFWAVLHKEFSTKTEDEVMTIAQSLIAEGIERGIEQGIEKGIEKGIMKEKIEVAKRLIIEGMELDIIAKITLLPLVKLKALQKDIRH
ncbi:Rpn family recombination-promoting nuclease/putative transposase [soil metagenome]